MCPFTTPPAQGMTHTIETHMEICLCIYFFWPPPSSWQRQHLQSMETYSVSPATVTKQMINIFMNENVHTAKVIQMIIAVSHIKLFLKASLLCILANSPEGGNGCLQLMGKHTRVSTSDMVTEGIMDEHVLVLQK